MIGRTLSHYKITAKLGEGGMGEVYLAEDTTLERQVAIKVLPPALAGDRERLVRFKREARVLASLNHSNIAHLYGLEEVEGRQLLVMELASGEPLVERLRRGPVALEEAIAIALQISEAVESAHEQGVIHRDLKPANIKVTAEGMVKVLDFGLAKALTGETTLSADTPTANTDSPTLTAEMTQVGMLLGTPAYMSPEQVKGLAADRRADIWAFGVVLWEMLTGRRMFNGATSSEMLAAVLRDPIDGDSLPAETPAALRMLLARCLERDPRSRLRDIGEARVALTALATEGASSPLLGQPGSSFGGHQARRSSHLTWLLAALATLVAVIVGMLWLRQQALVARETGHQRIVTSILPSPGTRFDANGGIALSPDGRELAFVVLGEIGERQLWVRPLNGTDSHFIEGTAGARYPFWSPDGRNLGFFAEGSLKRVAAAGGPARDLAPATNARGGTWCRGDRIVYSPDIGRGLQMVSATGGEPTDLTQLDTTRGETQHRLPFCLPSGEHVLVLSQTAEGGSRIDDSRIDWVELDTRERRGIVSANSSMAYATSGHLLFWQDGALLAAGFNLESLTLTTEGRPIAQEVAYTDNEYAVFSISRTGHLVYQERDAAESQSRLLTVNMAGEDLREASSPDVHDYLAVSHDGRRAIYQPGDFSSLWIRDLERDTTSRFTHADGDHLSPVWSPRDDWLAFATDRENVWEIFRRRALGLGAEELLFQSDLRVGPVDWSMDGNYLSVDVLGLDANRHIALYSFENQALEVLVDSPFDDHEGYFSPDMQWLAYTSNETGRDEIYVVSLAGAGGKFRISNDGGSSPQWAPDGDRLFYFSLGRELMVVDVALAAKTEISAPRFLFAINSRDRSRPYGVRPDGASFVVRQFEESEIPDQLILVQNWMPPEPQQ